MPAMAFPVPDPSVVARHAEIVAGLAALLPPECLVENQNERSAFETDGLAASRQVPAAVVLPRSTEGRASDDAAASWRQAAARSAHRSWNAVVAVWTSGENR